MNKTQCIELFLAAHGFDENVTVENFKHNAGDEGGLMTFWNVKATNAQFGITIEVEQEIFDYVLDKLIRKMHWYGYFKKVSECYKIKTLGWKYLDPRFKKKAQ